MAATIQLRTICHSRAGDKGDISDVSLIAYDKAKYDIIAREVTAERVKSHFGSLVKGEVRRYELPRMGALKFVMEGALDGGVTRSLRVDAHGKSFSSYLLAMEIEVPE
jgi:hypothetical protein